MGLIFSSSNATRPLSSPQDHRSDNARENAPGHFEIPLRIVVGDFNPILYANIGGEVVLPDKTRIAITLHDDGANEDARTLDGIYSRVFAHNMPGGYTAELVTTGVSSRNEPFKRYTNFSFAFPGAVPGRDHPEIDPKDPRNEPCIPCLWLRALLILIFILLILLFWRNSGLRAIRN
ncbi:MAG: hypothetical protein GY789_24215 [Hyphomicrobiales bacterium]|nr:hypothetical protein [Hyphomicrobiales bacterium]